MIVDSSETAIEKTTPEQQAHKAAHQRKQTPPFGKAPVRRILTLALLVLIPQLIANAIAFPGFIQADHQWLIARIAMGEPWQWHSLLWGYLAFPMLYLSPSYGLYGIFQTMVLASCVTYAAYWLHRLHIISYRGAVFLALLFGLSPTFLLYNQLYASDIVFTYVLIPLTVDLIRIVWSKGRIFAATGFDIQLVLLLILTYQLRKNAALIPVAVFALAFLYYSQARKRLLACGAVFVIASMTLGGFWTYVVRAEQSPSQELLSVPSVQIGRVFANGGYIPEDVADDLSAIRSPQQWKDAYVPYSADSEKTGTQLTPTFVKDWLVVGLHNPRAYVQAYADLLHPFWQLTGSTQAWGLALDFQQHTLFTNGECKGRCRTSYVEQVNAPLSPGRQFAASFQSRLEGSHMPIVADALRLVFFNRALPLWVFVIGLGCAIRKKNISDYLLVSAPLFCILIALLCFAPIASFRYAFQAFGVLPILVAYLHHILRPGSSSDGLPSR